jgi:N6-adenosine-specific RNA methylase IME4
MPDGMLPLGATFHPIANLFPLMQGAQFTALVEDIKVNGLRHPIVEFEGAILDGRNRHRACLEAGVPVKTEKYRGKDPLGYAMSVNLQRRHLNESQRSMIAIKLANVRLGDNQHKRGSANLPTLSQSDAARMLGVSERSVRSAKTVRDSAIPEFVQRVEGGELAVSLVEKVAKLPKDQQKKLVNADEAELQGATKKHRRATREEELGEATKRANETLADKQYQVILADPPWRFEPYSRDTGMDRAADNHYPTMTVEKLMALKAPATDDAVLFLWATVPMLLEAIDVLEAWGFEYKSHFVWEKDRIGTGYWNRNKHELLLVGTRGSIPAPAPGEQYDSVIPANVGKHSAKPIAFAEMIEAMFPNLPAVEMFARAPRLGWDTWGNEA